MSLQWEKELFDEGYDGGYGINWFHNLKNQYGEPMYAKNATLVSRFAKDKNASILVIGCGYGYLNTELQKLGFVNVWGIDSSNYINETLEQEKASPINFVFGMGEDPEVAKELAIRSGITEWDLVVTEAVLESYNPELDEFDVLIAGLEKFKKPDSGKIIHIVYVDDENTHHDNSLPITWMTLSDWHDLKPDHVWVSAIHSIIKHEHETIDTAPLNDS